MSPKIYAFNNGGPPGFISAVAIAEDGTCLGGHLCSSEHFIPGDLGVTPGSRPDRHRDQYSKHYPDGYEMEFVPSAEISGHEGLQRAFKLNAEQGEKTAATGDA